MKKVIISNVLAFAMVAGSFAGIAANANAATSYVFSNYLTVGSTGADVVALQSWLVANGFLTMPAGVDMGYFGSLTKAAVVAYQASIGLPSTGYVGPLTVAKLNGGASASVGGSTLASCPAGYSCMPTTPTAPAFSCPVGWTCTAPSGTVTTGTTPAAGLTAGTDGSLTVGNSALVSSGQSLQKGQTADVIAVQLQAVSGPVAVNRFDVHFNVRPWLFFSQFTLHDSNGKVIATKSISSINDVTEVSVGSDYLVRFDGLNYVVNPGPYQNLEVGATVLASTDKIGSSYTVGVAIPTGSIRTINGLGYSDSSAGLSSGTGSSLTTAQNVTLLGTASNGNVLVRISPNTPVQRIITLTQNQVTSSVVLGVFSLQSQNNSGTITSLTAKVQTPGTIPTTDFSNIRLMSGSQTYGASTFAANGTVTFTDLNLSLAENTWQDLTLEADVNASSSLSNFTASSSLQADGASPSVTIVGVDSNFNVLTNAGNTAISNDISFLQAGVSVTNTAVTAGTPVTSNNSTIGYSGFSYSFTLNNTGNSDVYISKTPAVALATSTAGSSDGVSASSASTTLTYVTANVSTQPGDSSAAYDIPAGTSRTFTYNGTISIAGTNAHGLRVFAITGIKFGPGSVDTAGASGDNATTINYGLSTLVTTNSF